jgi:hypothetical protein
MKKCIILSALLLSGLVAFSQSRAIEDFHNKYKNNGKYFSVRIDGGILNLLSGIETSDEEAQEMLDAISRIDAIDVHSINRNEDEFAESDISKFKKAVQKEKYDELMIVRDGDTDVDFLIKEKKGKISDLLLLVDEPDEFIIVSISGEIDLKTIADITENLDLKGSEHMGHLEEN